MVYLFSFRLMKIEETIAYNIKTIFIAKKVAYFFLL